MKGYMTSKTLPKKDIDIIEDAVNDLEKRRS